MKSVARPLRRSWGSCAGDTGSDEHCASEPRPGPRCEKRHPPEPNAHMGMAASRRMTGVGLLHQGCGKSTWGLSGARWRATGPTCARGERTDTDGPIGVALDVSEGVVDETFREYDGA